VQSAVGLLRDAERPGEPSTLSDRSLADSQAEMGYGTTRPLERVMASCGLLTSAELEFVAADDVPNGGVLCALPALLAEGLLRHTRTFYRLPPGFYPLESIFLALALLALVRCRSLEQSRYLSPGEWGKLLGLDRLPEVKTLRRKISDLCGQDGQAAQWQSRLAGEWMLGAHSQSVGLFYADGHVRVYHGSLTDLPRRYVARERLCLRGTTDYWINGLGGAPFFVLTQPVNPGLIAVLRQHIVPRLVAEAPQPDAEVLEADALLPRLTLIFDREGYSPDFFAELKAQRIAILTYHKFPGEKWPAAEFAPHTVRLHNGEIIELELAERGTRLSNGLWVREVRKLNASSGAQSSILSTDMRLDLTRIAADIAARWSQENFLKYMREHYGLDRLIEHGTQALPEAMVVVNPAWRRLNQSVRRESARLYRLRAEFGARALPAQPSTQQVQNFERRGGELQEKIQAQELSISALKEKRRQAPTKLTLKELPETERFAQLKTEKKHFIDTIKLIAYRAESALAGEIREALSRDDDGRALLRRLFVTPANLRPDPVAQTLTVELHRLGSPLQDLAVAHLCQLLTDSQTLFPTTNLRLIFRQVGSS
jgi:transposase-like protein